MSSHTAHMEIVGLLQAAGVDPDAIIRFNRLLVAKPDLAAWLDTPNSLRTRTMADFAEAGVREAARFAHRLPRIEQ